VKNVNCSYFKTKTQGKYLALRVAGMKLEEESG
jgi:hypothetical protein